MNRIFMEGVTVRRKGLRKRAIMPWQHGEALPEFPVFDVMRWKFRPLTLQGFFGFARSDPAC
ncbi:hypothetical protein [Azospirillum sp. TSA6c]|uniref:hypothetical protein n=1 Tax=unclassified Azospirillum TaxID=2630922 RepID=UPI0011B6A69A|nr:hypothetical protein [Azospirillum sp. TSA6c]